MRQEGGSGRLIAYGISMGAGIGIVISALCSLNIGMGIAIGAALGLVLTATFDQSYRRRDE